MYPVALLGDWGTTRLRLYSCDIDRHGIPEVKASVEGPGVKDVSDFQAAFFHAVRQLPECRFESNVILAGMVGSNIGWQETGYVACPASWDDVLCRVISFSAGEYRVTLLPGASCINEAGYHDVMRGEETQLIGLSQIHLAGRAQRLVCLPGTHTKWAVIDEQGLQRFATTVQGELFDVLRRHSILVRGSVEGNDRSRPVDRAAFAAAVDLLLENDDLGLIQALFSTRSRQLSGEISPQEATSHLSGLLIGADVRDVCRPMLRDAGIEQPVLLVGDELIASLYADAMARNGIDSCRYSGTECIVRGLAACHRGLQQERVIAT